MSGNANEELTFVGPTGRVNISPAACDQIRAVGADIS